MWVWSQRDGTMTRADLGTEVFSGYSGAPEAKNDPARQAEHNVGPIPVGVYSIQDPVDTMLHGPFVLALTPDLRNQMFGRSGFFIHGPSMDPAKFGQESKGCIVIMHASREKVSEMGVNRLQVIAYGG